MTLRHRVAGWLDRIFERLHHGRLRPATHWRREVENAHLARTAIVNHYERTLNLCEDEVNMLWDRHRERERIHGRPDA